MIIHLIAPHNSQEISASLLTIAKLIRANGDVLAYDWLDQAHPSLEEMNEAVTKADLLIIEGSDYSFDVGLDAAMATQAKKPTLFLSRNELTDISISGISNQYLTIRSYSSQTELETTVKTFLADNALDAQDQRFNFFIDRQIYNYLRNKSYETGKTKSEIIRQLLDNEISKRRA